ncbi:MAG: uroporphyrinogen decarboxylase [Hyphomicrobiales bacterium]|nr:uroporphyrinogen decarboxylase [Hyphomicrobiales bacterium]
MKAPASPFLCVLAGEALDAPPIWIMRQAGRYLPEYRETRARAGSFLDLCYNPALAAEVTLQPIRRFGFDASIVFSDILVVPDALGQPVSFHEGEGPRLPPLENAAAIAKLDPAKTGAVFEKVYETVERVCAGLGDTPLIGFCGAPWTVATYMIAGRGTPDQAPARLWAYRDPASFQALIDLLVETSVGYLVGQIKAGARAVMIFDSWAGVLPQAEFERWCAAPAAAVAKGVRERASGTPIIGFPRGANENYASFVAATDADALGCDTTMTPEFMTALAARCAVQGNLDPLALVAGGAALEDGARRILAAMRGKRHIFNLGHGILPETPVEHVEKLIALVRAGG